MSLCGVLRQRRLSANVPAVPFAPLPPGTEKKAMKQGCSQRSRCSHAVSIAMTPLPLGNHHLQQVEKEPATPAEIAVIIGGLKAAGRSLGMLEALAREAKPGKLPLS